ncbi:transketolase [Aristaeella hokkaidonensis]|uniref:Transketolase n=1 Tax=Aristaeella hokkaidonensis TaxID=3046382 RepID=A0AC61MUF8_9FIRM|nr:transketolase [Aristaeella hokkaidonensis]QUC65905.1 transketolase [Aristaeella hokkaidonensis]SNT93880.1 transketolase subunit A [Aristaeella hokkaidonensis]
MESYEALVHSGFEGEPDVRDPKTLAWLIRRNGLEMTHLSRGSHIGSVLSVAEIIAVLYARVLNVDPKEPKKPDRDRLILSKGHAGSAVYAALAETGFFPVEQLKTHYANGSILSGHVSHKGVPGVEVSTGSLGHGLGVGTGMALGAKMDGAQWRTYVVLGDGECDEGSVWEAALQAAQYKLDRLIAVVDYNHMQSLATVDETLRLEPFEQKWKDFGWNAISVDGHDTEALLKAFEWAKENAGSRKPSVILAHTVKGKGISFMENNILWHYRTPQGEEYDAALKELEAIRP